MQISEQWLREWVDPNVNTAQLSEALTMLGLEVDSVEPAAPEFKSVVVAHVLSAKQHPDADRLRVCELEVGEASPVTVVCGGVNVREGLKVALVKVGGELPGNFKIKKAKLRGVESSGMICSATELKLGEDEAGHILELPQDAPVGCDFREYLQLNDKVIDIDLTPNRGDCASVLGIARDLCAKFKLTLSEPKILNTQQTCQDSLKVTLQSEEVCPRYVGRIIKNINLKAETPLWMQERLRRSGLRTVNPVVDIGNYVMLELGQPMHAFDLDKLSGDLTVRFGKTGEKIVLLDEREVELNEQVLVIADETQAQAVAGVMGGYASCVDEETRNLFIESAYFDSTQIFKSAHQLNVSTDSSYRFERGVDYALQAKALARFTQLLLEICGGEPGPVVEVVAKKTMPQPAEIQLRQRQIPRILGVELEKQEVESILTRLGMQVTPEEAGWHVLVPSHRPDLTQESDLLEELIRIHGYETLPATTMTGDLKVGHQPGNKLSSSRLQDLFKDLGYSEAITYSFVDPTLQKLFDPQRDFLKLANPLSAEISVMRTSLWPGLVQALQYNLNRQVERIRLFETGLVFIKEGETLTQLNKVGGLIAGLANEPQWGQKERAADFFDLKGDIEQLFSLVNQTALRWERSKHCALHPGRSSDVYINDTLVGSFGALHPELVDSLGLSIVPYVFEFDFGKIETILPKKFNLLSKYPAVRRDLAIVVDENISAATVIELVRKLSGQLLRDVKIFDIYQGEGIEFGKKSVAMGLVFQDPERTLVDQEINMTVDRVISGLEDKLKATLRA